VRIEFPNASELEAQFIQKYGDPSTTGWAPRRRRRFGYAHPADVYEALIARLVRPGTRWLDVGGGRSPFPDNVALGRELIARSGYAVAVDPSPNVLENRDAHEAIQSTLEDYTAPQPFDLATARMVVEHVEDPASFAGALGRHVRPGGLAVVLTVSLWSPITVLSRVLPFSLHHPLKKLFWGGEEEDTFPVQYRMNTRAALRDVFARAGFEEAGFTRLDDLSLLGAFKIANYFELSAWRVCSSVGLRYPEHCLLGVYRRNA
jgi:2-polyprenyl-3-methyl-5-hydroxy-6-metoxy-1,4-benzoquinol methylase